MRALLIVAAVAWLGACGGKQAAPPPPPDRTDAAPPAPGVADAGSPALTDAECAEIVDRMIDLNLAQRRAERGDEAVPDPADIERIRADTKAEFVPPCQNTLDRAAYECAMRAETMDALRTCE